MFPVDCLVSGFQTQCISWWGFPFYTLALCICIEKFSCEKLSYLKELLKLFRLTIYNFSISYFVLEILRFVLKDECPVDALRACVFIYLPYILKKQRRVSEKIT